MFEIEWINNRGDREMNDVKMQRAKREWVPFTVMSEQLLSMRKVIGEKFKVQKPFFNKRSKRGNF